jgi:hypothetical protein
LMETLNSTAVIFHDALESLGSQARGHQ